MSNRDDWTPVVGWVKAGVQIPIRAAAATAAAWLGLWLLQILIGWLEGQIQQEISTIGWGMILLLGIVSGLTGGFILSWKLTDQTGLLGSHLLIPVCGLLVAGLVLLQWGIGSASPEWGGVSLWMFGVSGIAAAALTVKRLLLDS